MKKLFFLSVAATLISSLSFATIRRVGYPGTPVLNVDYPDVTQANDNANNNDTIQIYGSQSGNITKPLVIIGFGYNFDANAGLQAIGGDIPSQATLGFYEGSNGTVVTGVDGTFNIIPADITTNQTNGSGISNITFQRCRGSFSISNLGTYGGSNYGAISNIKIYSSVIYGGGMVYTTGYPGSTPVTNIQVYNCILYAFQLDHAGTTAAIINCVGSPINYAPSQLSFATAGCLIKNCIFGNSNAASNVNTIYESNFFGEAQPQPIIPGSNNRWSQDWGVIFNRLGGTDDAPGYVSATEFDEDYYILKAGSPAINGGFNAASAATNCGIYGGELAYVYKLSGVPGVPAIYQLTAPNLNATSNPYNVTISVRSNN